LDLFPSPNPQHPTPDTQPLLLSPFSAFSTSSAVSTLFGHRTTPNHTNAAPPIPGEAQESPLFALPACGLELVAWSFQLVACAFSPPPTPTTLLLSLFSAFSAFSAVRIGHRTAHRE